MPDQLTGAVLVPGEATTMRESVRRLRILAALVLAAMLGAAMPARADDGAVCAEHMRAIGRALAAYEHDQGKLPPYLSDLCPRYLRDPALLHCPADRTAGSPGLQGAPRDPLPISYIYEMTNEEAPRGLSLGLNLVEPADGATWREVKQLDRVNFGDRVPVVSCWHHLRQGYRAYLTPTGQVYRSTTYWEFDPGTLLAMAGQIERDLAAGSARFREHWRPNAIAWYGFAQAGTASLRAQGAAGTARNERQGRLRTAAARLTAAARADPELAGSGAWSAAGSLWYAAGDRKHAIEAYETATRRSEWGQVPGFLLLASLSRHAGQRREATALLQRMPRVEPQDLDWIARLANAYTRIGQPGPAVEWWLRRADLEAIGRPGVQAPLDPDAGTCCQHLQAIGRALAAYQRDHMELPPHLSDLYPTYLADRRLLHCPSDSTQGDPGFRWMEPDPVPVSYLYEMSLARHPLGMMLGPAPGGRVETWRDLKMCHRVQFGDRVPVVSCWHHLRQQYRLNLTLTGQVYSSSVGWDRDPDSLRVMLDRMERDLAAGPEPFRRRWWPSTVTWFCYSQAGWAPIEVRDRMRAVAGKLAAAAQSDPSLALNSVADLTGSLWYAGGDTEKAIAAFRSAMRLPGRNQATAYLLLADIYRHTGRAEEARDLLRQMPAPRSWEINSMGQLANIYANTGRPDRAAEWSQQLPPARRRLDLNTVWPFLAVALALLTVIVLAIFGAVWVSSRKRWRVAPAGPAAALLPPDLAGFDLQPLPAESPAAPPTDFSRPASEPSPSSASGVPFEAPVREAPSHPVGENEPQEGPS